MVLYFLLLLFCLFILKAKKLEILISMCLLIVFNLYTSSLINSYDCRYIDVSSIEGEFEIVSYRAIKDYYDKYIVKSKEGNKFILYL